MINKQVIEAWKVALPILSLIGLLAGLIVDVGWGFIIALIFASAFIGYRVLTAKKRFASELQGLLSQDHKWMLEFMNVTYLGKNRDIICKANINTRVSEYYTKFIVNGSDCLNTQRITGRNSGQIPLPALSFAVVGGSTLSIESLGAKYSVDSVGWIEPEFVVDEERFKVAYCRMHRPLATNESFEILYSDRWPSSMREGSDGFFFPEAIYFPAGIEKLTVEICFDFLIRTIYCLEADIDRGIVRPCLEQPMPCDSPGANFSQYIWSHFSPSTSSIFIILYNAA
jgi:hypothetical protein